MKGRVTDPSGRPIVGAQIAAVNEVGIIAEQITDDQGQFDFNVSPLYENARLRVTAPGFQAVTLGEGASSIQLQLAPQTETVNVLGSAIDLAGSQSGTSTNAIASEELRERNEAQAFDLMRELPGMVFAQDGPRGSATDLFVRGGSSNYNLVLLDGIPINSFYYGGLFDFAPIPSDFLREIDVAEGPQSAIYGSYAISSVVSFLTRSPGEGPSLDIVAEGGTHDENRFAISGSGMIDRWGVSGSVLALRDRGAVVNSDYRDDNVFLSAEHRWTTQNIFAFWDFSSNHVGEPGPWGSDPAGLFPGVDTVSRSKNNSSTYGLHYQDSFTDKLRLDLILGFYLNNSLYISPFAGSFNRDLRPYGDARASWHPLSFWTLAAGFAYDREEMKNTYVAATNGYLFPLRRDDQGIYFDNQFSILNRLFINAGLREEIYEQAFVPGDALGFPPRPDFPARNYSRLNPKVSGALILQPGLRLHASFGTGIRPPGGADLAFTDNPDLRPERTVSYDAGIEERLLNNRASIDLTWFHNRYKDLIVGLGGSLNVLSAFSAGNLANSKSEGAVLTGRLRPANWFSLTANYMWLETDVLSLTGSSGLVQQYFYLGQPLLRQPKQSGSAVFSFEWKRVSANLVAYLRGRDLDVEPNFGASAGLFPDPGYANLGLNINYRIHGNLTAFANLRNGLDRRYEEILGYPAPLLSVVAGLKWSLARAR